VPAGGERKKTDIPIASAQAMNGTGFRARRCAGFRPTVSSANAAAMSARSEE